jgi:tetratricopeptide (TPR) repeat protein
MTWLLACSLAVLATTSGVPPEPSPQGDPAAYPSLEALRRYAGARLLEERGARAEALAELYRALAADPNSDALALRAADVAAHLGQPERSLEMAGRVLGRDSTVARAHWLRGAALFNLGQSEAALPALERAVALAPDDAEFARTLAHVGERLDRVDVTARAWGRVVRLDADDAEAWFQVGTAEARSGRFERADSALARAEDLNPDRPGLHFLRGLVQESLGRPAVAIERYRRHLGAHPQDVATRRRLVELLAADRRWDEAWASARRVAQAAPLDAEAAEMEADLALRAGRGGEARAALERLQSADPADPARAERAVRVLLRNRRADEGAALAERWARRHPGDMRGTLLAARARAGAKDWAAAERHARAAVAAAPDSIEPRATLARIQGGAGRWAEAETTWAAVLRDHPGHAPGFLALGYARQQRDDIPGAEAAVRDLLARRPDDATALNFLGYMLADRGLRLEEALALIRRAVELDPDNGAFIDSLGWVFFRLGRLEEARTQLERALRLTGGDPEVHEHLGDVYKALALMDLAREQYRQALASDPDNPRLRGKLSELP